MSGTISTILSVWETSECHPHTCIYVGTYVVCMYMTGHRMWSYLEQVVVLCLKASALMAQVVDVLALLIDLGGEVSGLALVLLCCSLRAMLKCSVTNNCHNL